MKRSIDCRHLYASGHSWVPINLYLQKQAGSQAALRKGRPLQMLFSRESSVGLELAVDDWLSHQIMKFFRAENISRIFSFRLK